MKKIKFLSMLILITNILLAQETKKGDILIDFSIGTSFSNLLNSEAPHKILNYEPSSSFNTFYNVPIGYINYESGVLKDILIGVSFGTQIEYFIKKSLSLSSGIFYHPKGINLNYSNTNNVVLTGSLEIENLNLKIKNNYLSIPIMLRKYILKKKNIFVEAGINTNYLISSRFDFFHKKIVTEDNGYYSYTFARIDNKKDKKREYTNKLDYGISFGSGYVKNLSKKLRIKSELLLNIGVRKVDSKYNNEFSIISSSGIIIKSTNYFALNSNAKNINLLVTTGLGYRIGK